MELSLRAEPQGGNRPVWLIALLIAVLHAGMAITAADKKSPIFDEPAHLTAGYSYWSKNDFRLDPENGNFANRWAALPLLLARPAFVPLTDRGWIRGEEGRTGHQFFYEAGNNPDLMLRQARMMMSLFGLGLCLLIYRIGREFFGTISGLVAETIAAFDPTLLGHGALVTSDVAATLFFTAAIWSTWRLLQKISPASFFIIALSLSGLFLTKFSAPVVLPALAVAAAIRIFSAEPIEIEIGRYRHTIATKSEKLWGIAAAFMAVAAAVVLSIWVSFSFRYSAWTNEPNQAPAVQVSENQMNHDGSAWHWDQVIEGNGTFGSVIQFARRHHILPEAYLYGLAYVHTNSEGRPSFLDNRWSIVGFRSFFPKAFMYKTPLPFLSLLGLALIGAVGILIMRKPSWPEFRAMIRRHQLPMTPFWAFLVIYGLCALNSDLNIGHRHLLPIYPVLFIASGAAVMLLNQYHRLIGHLVIGVLLLWQIGESMAARPNYLSYFNAIAGGPGDGYKHLVDSSLDWGQDLPALKTWLDDNQIKNRALYLAYFGTADPRWYEITARSLPDDRFTVRDTPAPLRAGTYCISATTLQSVYTPQIGPWCLPYEADYQIALGQMSQYYQAGYNLSAPAHLVANETTLSRLKKVREFETLRFARLCAYLRHRKPVAQVGYSIFIYNLTGNDINRALNARPAECARNISVIGY